jgi:hypothetical protein
MSCRLSPRIIDSSLACLRISGLLVDASAGFALVDE